MLHPRTAYPPLHPQIYPFDTPVVTVDSYYPERYASAAESLKTRDAASTGLTLVARTLRPPPHHHAPRHAPTHGSDLLGAYAQSFPIQVSELITLKGKIRASTIIHVPIFWPPGSGASASAPSLPCGGIGRGNANATGAGAAGVMAASRGEITGFVAILFSWSQARVHSLGWLETRNNPMPLLSFAIASQPSLTETPRCTGAVPGHLDHLSSGRGDRVRRRQRQRASTRPSLPRVRGRVRWGSAAGGSGHDGQVHAVPRA